MGRPLSGIEGLLDNLSDQLLETQGQRDRLDRATTELEAENVASEERHVEARERIEGELAEARSRIAALEADLEQARRELADLPKLEAELQDLRTERDRAQAALAEREAAGPE